VAAVDRHTVHALDADSGEPLWSFTAGARVDSPPTVWQGRVLFGSADGFVYCLRADDGELVWRFRAAPEDLRLTAEEQVESVWPVPGSVLVREGVVYCVAGRSMWLDGGLRLLRLDAATGRVLSETVLDDKYPGTDDTLQRDIRWPNLPVALPDVLSCDGEHVYMRSQPFDLEGRRTEVITPRDATVQRGETAHLFCPTGFLDDSWWHRSYWIYGRTFVGGAGGWYLAAYQAPAGRILAVDDTTVYGFGRVPMRFTGTPNTYHLFACDKQPELKPQGGPRKRGASAYGPIVPARLAYHWSESVPIMVRAMVAAGETLFVAGPPELADETEVYALYGEEQIQTKMAEHVAAFEGHKGGLLLAVSKKDGSKRSAYRLPSPPVFDGMAAARERLFISTMDGHVLCLAAGSGKPLKPAPDVEPGPVSAQTTGFYTTTSHPDFQQLTAMRVTRSDLGYRMQTSPGGVGLALKKLDTPLKKHAEFRVRVRPTPGAPAPDTPGNAFIAFGDSADEPRLVKCGFRIAGRHLYIIQGPLADGRGASKPLTVKANEATEFRVLVDIEKQTATVTMQGETVESPLERRLDAITWLGYCVASVTSDFGRIEIEGE
jgi:outer membrane protein assembly factor BamB